MPNLSLIVAEDDPFLREWLQTVLERLGARVHTAANGRELLSFLASERDVDLVISDVRMPGPSGLEVLAIARARGLDVAFLFITGCGGADVHADAAKLGATVLDKPFSARDLVASVRRLCGMEAAADLSSRRPPNA